MLTLTLALGCDPAPYEASPRTLAGVDATSLPPEVTLVRSTAHDCQPQGSGPVEAAEQACLLAAVDEIAAYFVVFATDCEALAIVLEHFVARRGPAFQALERRVFADPALAAQLRPGIDAALRRANPAMVRCAEHPRLVAVMGEL